MNQSVFIVLIITAMELPIHSVESLVTRTEYS